MKTHKLKLKKNEVEKMKDTQIKTREKNYIFSLSELEVVYLIALLKYLKTVRTYPLESTIISTSSKMENMLEDRFYNQLTKSIEAVGLAPETWGENLYLNRYCDKFIDCIDELKKKTDKHIEQVLAD